MRDLEKYNENFDKIYNSFSKETVGNNQIKLMPPLSNKPKIQRLSYDKEKDVFEIVFKFDNASRTKKSDNVIFVENIIDKRKLNFVKSVIQNDYNEISKGNLNLIKQET